jgi:chaperonin cofactor prefoldin
MVDELEKRVNALERSLDRLAGTMEHLAEDIHDMKGMMRQALDQSLTISTMKKEMETLWKKVDICINLKEDFAVLQSEHEVCTPKIEKLNGCAGVNEHRIKTLEDKINSANAFVNGRVASLTDKVIWVGVGVIAFIAVFLAAKGIK